jgi:allantoin racemase
VLTAAARHAADVDAILLAVSYDTALMAVRELLDIPVVGMTEAGMVAACLLGARFGLVVFGTPELYREHVAALGFGPRFAGLRSVDMSAASAFSDREAVLARVTDAAQALAREDGAEAVVLCGAAMAGMATTLQRAVDVPLVDGIAAGVPLAEMLVRLKPVAPRTGSLARPRARASAGLDPALAALLARS